MNPMTRCQKCFTAVKSKNYLRQHYLTTKCQQRRLILNLGSKLIMKCKYKNGEDLHNKKQCHKCNETKKQITNALYAIDGDVGISKEASSSTCLRPFLQDIFAKPINPLNSLAYFMRSNKAKKIKSFQPPFPTKSSKHKQLTKNNNKQTSLKPQSSSSKGEKTMQRITIEIEVENSDVIPEFTIKLEQGSPSTTQESNNLEQKMSRLFPDSYSDNHPQQQTKLSIEELMDVFEITDHNLIGEDYKRGFPNNIKEFDDWYIALNLTDTDESPSTSYYENSLNNTPRIRCRPLSSLM